MISPIYIGNHLWYLVCGIIPYFFSKNTFWCYLVEVWSSYFYGALLHQFLDHMNKRTK